MRSPAISQVSSSRRCCDQISRAGVRQMAKALQERGGAGQTNTGRLIGRTDTQTTPALSWARTYEAATGRMDTQTVTAGAATLATFDLGYDLAGNVVSKASAVGTNGANGAWTYDLDGASRMTKATLVPTTGATQVFDHAYDGGSNRTKAKLTTGAVVTSDWTSVHDAAGLVTSSTNAVGGEAVTYSYDAAGIRLTTADSTTSANDRSYAYDAYARLVCTKLAATSCTSGTLSSSESQCRLTITTFIAPRASPPSTMLAAC